MSIGSIRLINTKKVLKAYNKQGTKQHFLGINKFVGALFILVSIKIELKRLVAQLGYYCAWLILDLRIPWLWVTWLLKSPCFSLGYFDSHHSRLS